MQASKDRDGLDVWWGAEEHVAERLAFRDLSRSALSQPLMRTRFDEVAGVCVFRAIVNTDFAAS